MSNDTTTLVPPSYPELTDEIYRSLEDGADTLMPPASRQLELEIDCLFPESL